MPGRAHLRVRQRLLLVYAGIVTAGAAVLVWLRPDAAVEIVMTALIGLVAAWAVAVRSSRRFRRRLHELREATDALASGKMLEHLRGLPSDDFVKLSTSVERLAEQLREMTAEQDRLRQRLSRSEKLAVIGELAATVAHEVNNPLDGLQNSIEIIRRRNGDEQTARLLDMMESGLERIETTVRRLLTMSRDDPIELMPTRVEEIVDDAVAFVQPRLNRYCVRLVREYPAGPVVVQADASHMAQTLINLMMNAAYAMKDTGGTLTIRCRPGERSDRAWIEVIDTGTGIDDDDLPRIFEPFYSTKSKDAGTGLGLSVVARVVEAHHGRIEVQTQLGKGTTFRIELPAADVQTDVIVQSTFDMDRLDVAGASSIREL